jgi:preprotein translocase subunit YajC
MTSPAASGLSFWPLPQPVPNLCRRVALQASSRQILGHYNFGLSRLTDFKDEIVFISEAFAQTAPAAAGGGESTLLTMLPLVLMFVVLYFVMIRPQMKRQKEHKAMIDALAKGDEVITAGGLLGKVAKMGETYVDVEVSKGVELQVQRSAVVQVLPKGTIK